MHFCWCRCVNNVLSGNSGGVQQVVDMKWPLHFERFLAVDFPLCGPFINHSVGVQLYQPDKPETHSHTLAADITNQLPNRWRYSTWIDYSFNYRSYCFVVLERGLSLFPWISMSIFQKYICILESLKKPHLFFNVAKRVYTNYWSYRFQAIFQLIAKWLIIQTISRYQ